MVKRCWAVFRLRCRHRDGAPFRTRDRTGRGDGDRGGDPLDPPHAKYPARRTFTCRAARLIAGPSANGSSFAFWGAGAPSPHVLRGDHFTFRAVAIVPRLCDALGSPTGRADAPVARLRACRDELGTAFPRERPDDYGDAPTRSLSVVRRRRLVRGASPSRLRRSTPVRRASERRQGLGSSIIDASRNGQRTLPERAGHVTRW